MHAPELEDFDGTWPFVTRFFATSEVRLAYVDEGPRGGRPVVCLHGNPSWGYLYRAFVAPLVAAGHRVIVVDHLGFGRSDKPAGRAAYTVERHVARFTQLMHALELEAITLLLHDWGGPIGLAWATTHPGKTARLVLFNTFVHPPLAPLRLPPPLRLMRLPGLGELLVQGLHAIVRGFLLGSGVVRRERLRREVKRAYLSVCPAWTSRAAQLAFARAFPACPAAPLSPYHAAIAERLALLAHLPVLLVWGERDDICSAACRDAFEADFPHAETLRIADAGHFVQEDAPEIIVPRLLALLA